MSKKILLLGVFAFLIGACKDEKPSPPPIPDPEAPELEFTYIKTADATLQAAYISTISIEHQVGTYTSFTGVARAKFYDLNGIKALPKSAICEGYTLEENGSWLESHTENEQGIDFGSTTSWQVEGRGDVPTFTKEVLSKVPEIGDINIRDSINSRDSTWIKINLESAFTFIGNVDSVNYTLSGKLSELRYNLASANDSIGLSSAQLKSLGTGKIYIKVEAYRLETESLQGYKVAYVNKGMFYKPLWLH